MRKKSFLLFFMLLMLQNVSAHERTPDEMKCIALNVLNTKSSTQRKISSMNLGDIKELKRMERLSIIGNEDEGFVVISHDDSYKAVLGYSFTAFQNTLPCGLKWWLSAVNESMKNGSHTAKSYYDNLHLYSYPHSISPLITTKWGQEAPYNNKHYYTINGTPLHFKTGCVATAMAQVMNYHQYPDKGKDSISYVVWNYMANMNFCFEDSYYDWDLMADEYNIWNSFGEQAEAVSVLMRDCGIAVKSNFGTNSTGANSKNIEPALKQYFSYDTRTSYYERCNYTDSQWMEMIYNELSSYRPIIYNGIDNCNEEDPFGHSFVLHGYDSEGLICINWGWEGYCDGYYDIDMLSPTSDGAYNDEQDMVFVVPGSLTKVDPNSCKLRVSSQGSGKVYLDGSPGNYVSRTTKSFRIDKGGEVCLVICPEWGNHIASVKKNGVDVSSKLEKLSETKFVYKLNSIRTDTYIDIKFEEDKAPTHKVTVKCNYGGTVRVNGYEVNYSKTIEVDDGADVELAIIPDNFIISVYRIESVMINESDVTSEIVDNKYTIKNINQDINVVVVFAEVKPSDWILTIEAEGEGEVIYEDNHIRECSESFNVPYNFMGTSVFLTVVPDEGCTLEQVLVTKEENTTDETFWFSHGGWSTIRINKDTYLKVVFSDNKVGIDYHSNPSNEVIDMFDLSGKRINTLQKGINIIRYKDGATRKVITQL